MTQFATATRINGHSMVGALERVLVCPPRMRVGSNRNIGRNSASITLRISQKLRRRHDALCRELTLGGAEVIEIAPSDNLSLDAVYTHDASLATDFG